MIARIGNTRSRTAPRLAWSLTLSWLLQLHGPTIAQEEKPQAEPLRVRVQVPRESPYIGQGIELTVRVVAEADRPRIDIPRLSGADIWPIETDVSPLTATGIGETISQANLFLARYLLVPRRAGKLEIPSIRAEATGRAGKSLPLTLSVQSSPIQGRPGTFLGGIGTLAVRAEAEPATLRVGQSFEYRIHLDGPGAWGTTLLPDLGRFRRLPLGLEVTPIGNELTPNPPSRTIAYRIRATRPGEAVLPSTLISSFDPGLGRYLTSTTTALPVRVIAVDEFNPKSIDYRPPEKPARGLSRVAVWSSVGAISALMIATAWWLRKRRRRKGQSNKADAMAARRFAAQTDREWRENRAGPEELARHITASLIRYLELGAGRPPGALTPVEAGRGVTAITGSEALGDRAQRLLAACDRVLYGVARDGILDSDDLPASLPEEARELFGELG